MNKSMISVPNTTGRKFICLNSRPGLVDSDEFSEHFTVGRVYLEALFDHDSQNHINEGEEVLLLISDTNLCLYVDSKDFLLLSEQVNKLALWPISLN